MRAPAHTPWPGARRRGPPAVPPGGLRITRPRLHGPPAPAALHGHCGHSKAVLSHDRNMVRCCWIWRRHGLHKPLSLTCSAVDTAYELGIAIIWCVQIQCWLEVSKPRRQWRGHVQGAHLRPGGMKRRRRLQSAKWCTSRQIDSVNGLKGAGRETSRLHQHQRPTGMCKCCRMLFACMH
jgi:hypothetical protein